MFNYESEELMKRVAWMYYEDDLNQQEIADRLKLSRTKVLRLLKDSRESGFVRITLDVQAGLIFALEKQICHLSGMSECFIIPGGADVLQSVAKASAYRFAEALRSCERIGVGGGRTLHALVKELTPPDRVVTKEIVSMAGNTKPNLAIEPYDIASGLVNKLPVEFFHLWAPARVSTKEEAALIKSSPSIRTVLDKAEQVDIAFLGIGDMHNSSYVRYNYLNDQELVEIANVGGVGEVLGRFFDIGGRPIFDDLNSNYIAARLPFKTHVIGMAGGVEKTEAILGAVRTGWLNGLVTDEITANAIARALHSEKRGKAASATNGRLETSARKS